MMGIKKESNRTIAIIQSSFSFSANARTAFRFTQHAKPPYRFFKGGRGGVSETI